MAEDDFKECAESGKHIAMGRDVLDRIDSHYAMLFSESLNDDIETDISSREGWAKAYSELMEMVNVVLSYADLWNLYVRSDTRSDEDIMAAIRDVARGG